MKLCSSDAWDQAGEIIGALFDENECRYDHHGYCQEHGWLDESECPHSRARKWLIKYRPDLWKAFFSSAQQAKGRHSSSAPSQNVARQHPAGGPRLTKEVQNGTQVQKHM